MGSSRLAGYLGLVGLVGSLKTPWRTRSAQTSATGTAPTASTRESAIAPQVSSTPMITASCHRGRPRSSTSQVTRSGTEVPMCPTVSSRMNTPKPSCGASMIPPAISARAAPRRPDARPCLLPPHPPLASIAASSTASVYVIAAAAWNVPVFSPPISSSSMYCGNSVV